jgi:hypothetical protein
VAASLATVSNQLRGWSYPSRRTYQTGTRAAPRNVIPSGGWMSPGIAVSPGRWCNTTMDVSELIEDLMAYVPLPPSGSRSRLPDACLSFQPGGIQAFANVSALRATAESLARVAEDAARYFADHGRQDFLWFLGSRSTPSNAVDLLTARGATNLGDCAAMLLDHEPPPAPGADIRLVTTPAQLLTYRQIGAATEVAGEVSNDQDLHIKASNDTAWQDYTSYDGRRLNYIAYLEEEPVSVAGLLLTDHEVAVLSGAATLPVARGRGLYRALVHTRWTAAQRLKAGPLAVQASTMSAPVLAHVGFTRVADMTLLRQTIT